MSRFSALKLNQIKIEYIILLLIVILGSSLRIYGLDKSLWVDEVISVNDQRDLPFQLSKIYIPPHLYFVILHFFMLFGNSEIIIRLPSVIFGIFAILLIYEVGKLLFGRPREGLVSAFLLSISTMHIWHSQEARYYSISMFLTLFSLFIFYKAIKENEKKLWIGWIFTTILAILSHWYMIFILIIEIAFLTFIIIKNRNSFIMSIRKIGKKKISLLVLGLIIISILSLPITGRILIYIQTGHGWEAVSAWGIPPGSFFQELFNMFSFGFRSYFLSNLFGNSIATVFLYMFLLFFTLGLLTSFKVHREQTILLLLWVLLPATFLFLFSIVVGSPVVDAKYLIFILPGYLIGVSRGISAVSKTLLRFYYKLVYGLSSIPFSKRKQTIISSASIMIITVAFVGATVTPLNEYYEYLQEDWKAATEYLENNSHPGNLIIVEPDYLKDCLFYYYEKNSTTAEFFKNHTITVMSSQFPFAYFQDLISEHNGVWFISSPRHDRWVYSKILNWTQQNFIKMKTFAGIYIYYYNSESILISTKNMSFVGLDSSPDEPVAKLWHNNDSATLNVTIPKPTDYTIAFHTRPAWSADKGWLGKSSLELVINGVSKSIKTFSADDWSYVELGTFYLESGLQEIKIICRIGGDLGEKGILFDSAVIWPTR